MIDLVPGQVFRDIERFHEKFHLEPTKDPGHRLPVDLLKFRIKFMMEELEEYCEAVGAMVRDNGEGGKDVLITTPRFDAEQAFDALIDLVYVALGTAYLHRFPFNDGWARVQEKNMQKVRAARPEDSKRGSGFDVVKPEGWTPPVLTDLLDEVCAQCFGVGACDDVGEVPCRACGGKGTVKRTVSAQNNQESVGG
jgi:predicted HAD superfamily Cof-like phosphohydrolase